MSLVTTQTVSHDGRQCTIHWYLNWIPQILDECPVIVWFSLAVFKEGARNGFLQPLDTCHV
jgi:hypothetical protein